MGGIDLDPCAHPGSPTWELVKHRISLSKGGDGLTDEWKGSGGVFVNPPYSDVGPWIRRAREHARRRPVIMLIPTRPETRAWDAEILSAGGCIVQQVGRVRFVGADGQTHGNGMVTTWRLHRSASGARAFRRRRWSDTRQRYGDDVLRDVGSTAGASASARARSARCQVARSDQ
jgi:hypothetical protein